MTATITTGRLYRFGDRVRFLHCWGTLDATCPSDAVCKLTPGDIFMACMNESEAETTEERTHVLWVRVVCRKGMGWICLSEAEAL